MTAWLFSKLTRKGFLASAALPVIWIIFYWSFIAHVRLSLGRWPSFGEVLPSAVLQVHYHSTTIYMVLMVWSLGLVPLLALACLLSRKWKHLACYGLCYAACVGLAFGAVFLAPGPFLNWLFD